MSKHSRHQVINSVPKSKLITWRATGSTFLLVSFLAQNALMPVWTDRLRTIERGQLILDLEQARRDTWVVGISLLENFDKPNPKIEGRFLLEFLRAERNLIAWSAGRSGADRYEYSAKLKKREADLQKSIELYSSGKVDELEKLAQTAQIEAAIALPSDDGRFFARLDEARSSETKWYWIFVFGYSLGSIFLAIGYIRREGTK